MISERATQWVSQKYGLMEGLQLYKANSYSHQNPGGIINLGVAENELVANEMANEVSKILKGMSVSSSDFQYDDFLGLELFRNSIAAFLNKRLNISVSSEHINVHNGCTSAIESLFTTICDDGDAILIPNPYYGGFNMDLERRAGIKMYPIDLYGPEYNITIEMVSKAYETAIAEGFKIKALVIINPNNPLGIVHPPSFLQDVIDFSVSKNIHFVSDEIYCFSIWNSTAEKRFKSAYSLDIKNWNLVHIIWGFSKDFCLNGFRVGAVLTKNTKVRDGLAVLSAFTSVSSITQRVLNSIIEDDSFVTEFFRLNKHRLKSHYEALVQTIDSFNSGRTDNRAIRYVPGEAAFFIWTDLRDFMPAKFLIDGKHTLEGEKSMFLDFIQNGIYVAPGYLGFNFHEFGYFRINFATSSRQVLDIAVNRLLQTLEGWAKEM